jgi:hypothetical protein
VSSVGPAPIPDDQPVVSAPPRGRSVSRITVLLSIVLAVGVGAVVAIVASNADRDAERSEAADDATSALVPTLPGVSIAVNTTATTSPPTTVATTADTASVGSDTTAASTTSTVAATTTTVPVSPVVREHMVFHDGVALGRVTPDGFVPYEGEPGPQLRQSEIIVVAMSTLVPSQFVVQVRPLAPEEEKPRCPVGVQPRAASNAYPVGLWVELPNWVFAAVPIAPRGFGVNEQAILQAVLSSKGVAAPPPTAVQVVSTDLLGDGVPDTVLAASYRDESMYYRVVIVAADGDPAQATAVFFEQGPSVGADGAPIAAADGAITVDAIAEVTGLPPFELVIRVRGGGFAGATIRDVAGDDLASWSCPT